MFPLFSSATSTHTHQAKMIIFSGFNKDNNKYIEHASLCYIFPTPPSDFFPWG